MGTCLPKDLYKIVSYYLQISSYKSGSIQELLKETFDPSGPKKEPCVGDLEEGGHYLVKLTVNTKFSNSQVEQRFTIKDGKLVNLYSDDVTSEDKSLTFEEDHTYAYVDPDELEVEGAKELATRKCE